MITGKKSGIVLSLIALATLAWASSSGPSNSLTNAPSEGNCTQCHAGNSLNAIGGSLTLSADSIEYSSNDTIVITVNLSRASQSRWGFECTVLDSVTNSPVGTLIVTDALNTQKSTAVSGMFTGRQYIKHTDAGTFDNSPDASPGWSFKWAAPATTVGPVIFYAAGNAANSNGLTSGDFIYTTNLKLPAAACCVKEGDFNHNGTVNVVDVTACVAYLFQGGAIYGCKQEADSDDNNSVSVVDLTKLVGYLFQGGSIGTCP